MRLFIAEDETIIRMGLEDMVKSLGHQVVGTASTGPTALAGVRKTNPDLLLLDIRMPGLDGLTVAKQLLLEDKLALPVVLLTASNDIATIEQAADIPVMGYLIKPIHEGKLGPTLELAMYRFQNVQQGHQKITIQDLVNYMI